MKESARLDRTKLQQCAEDEQSESHEDLNMDISYEYALNRTTKNYTTLLPG